jgi:hypothetical protein
LMPLYKATKYSKASHGLLMPLYKATKYAKASWCLYIKPRNTLKPHNAFI